MFPIQPVPIPRATRPLQPPPFKDASDIILAAAHLQQQERGMQQQQVENLSNTLMSAAGLMEHKREAQASEAHAQALLDLQQQMQGPHMAEIEARTNLLKAQAGMYGGGGMDVAANLVSQIGSGDIAPSQANAVMSRMPPPIKIAYANAIANSGINLQDAESQYQQKLGNVRTNTGPMIQSRVRNYTAALPQLDTLNRMIDDLPQGNFQDLNGIQNALAVKSGSRAANAFKTQVSRLLLTLRAASPNGTDAVLDQDAQQLNLVKSGSQLRDSIRLLFKDAVNQRNVLSGPGTPVDSMSPIEQSYGLYPSQSGFGGLGDISQQDTSPGGGLMQYFGNLLGQSTPQQPTQPQGPSNLTPDVLAGVRAAKLRRKALQ